MIKYVNATIKKLWWGDTKGLHGSILDTGSREGYGWKGYAISMHNSNFMLLIWSEFWGRVSLTFCLTPLKRDNSSPIRQEKKEFSARLPVSIEKHVHTFILPALALVTRQHLT